MARYKYILEFSDGDIIDSYDYEGEDGLFDTKGDARDAAEYSISCGNLGYEILSFSEPGEYQKGGFGKPKIKIEKV